jgi:hypothetical protein
MLTDEPTDLFRLITCLTCYGIMHVTRRQIILAVMGIILLGCWARLHLVQMGLHCKCK